MDKVIEEVARCFGLSTTAVIFITAGLSIALSAIGVIYKENFFGFKDWVKKVLGPPVEEEKRRATEDGKEGSVPVPAPKLEEPSEVVTASVRFVNERLVHEIDLQRAIQAVHLDETATYRVPLQYEWRIDLLRGKLDNLYDDYERRLGEHASHEDFDYLNSTREFSRACLESLPSTVGCLIVRLKRERTELSNVQIGTICSRFIELRMAQILAGLTKFQLSSEEPILAPYAKLRSTPEYVSLIDSVNVEDIVSYRVYFYGDAREQVIFVPQNYGFQELLVKREFFRYGKGYVPPLSFMTEYAFPQQVFNNAEKPEEWNFDWRCASVDVKDLDGRYV